MALKKKHVDHLNGVGEIVQQDKKQADQYQQQNVGIFIAHLKKQNSKYTQPIDRCSFRIIRLTQV
jgi:hypothetical protein